MGLTEHAEHGDWTLEGRCVYCPCGARLYNGTVPADQRGVAEALDAIVNAVRKRNQGDSTA